VSTWQRTGTKIRRIDLNLFGGSVDLRGGTSTPRSEAFGALTSLAALACVTLLFSGLLLATRSTNVWLRMPIKVVAIASLGLLALQAMPALHLDGGRILRAWLWYLTDSPTTATKITGIYGHLVAVVLLGVGLALVARPGAWPFWGLASAVAGIQLESAVRRTLRSPAWRGAGASTTIRDLSFGPAKQIMVNRPVDDAVEQLLSSWFDRCITVVDLDGRPVGVLRLSDLRGTKRSMWDQILVGAVAKRLDQLARVSIDLNLDEAIAILEDNDGVAVIEDEGRIISIVTLGSLLIAMSDFTNRQRPARLG
jgi:CBS domain-containing protein